jgi:MSHA biogenesis protein MshQ
MKSVLLISCALITSGACSLLFSQESPDDMADADAAILASRSKTITIHSELVVAPGQGELVDFPLLVSLVDADIAATARPDGADIQFIDSDGSLLSHELETWDKATGELIAWVRIPSLPASEDKEITIRYDSADASGTSNSTEVWEQYASVYHMSVTGNETQISDSSPNENHGTKLAASEPALSPARIGDGQLFDGQNDYIQAADADSLDLGTSFTASLWLSFEKGTAPKEYERLLSKKREWDSASGWEFSLETDFDTELTVRGSSGLGSAGVAGVPSWQAGGWHHLVVVYQDATGMVYLDGQYISETEIAPVVDNELPLFVGRNGEGNTNFWMGRLDEIRLTPSVLSAEWIETEHNNQADPASFYALGPEA